ncbi:MAG: MBL fold metallo-hydrolase [Dehalococcoidia bacterium]
MQLTLLGTGTPIPMLERRGPATLVEGGNARILVDAGSGVVHRLLEAGQPSRRPQGGPPALTHIFLTHLHSDHIMGLPDLLWTGWIMDWWDAPPKLFGPPGTAEMMRRLVHTFEYDIRVRNSLDRVNQHWQTPAVQEFIDNGTIDHADFRATAFRVDHNPVDQAFGIRLDTESGSVAFSGDTRPLESLARAAHGVDLLLHEVYDSTLARNQLRTVTERVGSDSSLYRARAGVIGYHTLSEDLGPIADLADTPHLVLNHVIGPPDTANMERDIARDFHGQTTVGADLQRFEIVKG